MKRQRPTSEEIIKKPREAVTLLADGQSVEAVCKKLEVTPPTYHRWQQIRRSQGGDAQTAQGAGKGRTPRSKTGGEPGAGSFRPQGGGGGKMVGPERKRPAVRQVLEVSERRVCTTIRQPRATQRYRGIKRGKGAALAAELRRISAAHP